MADDPELETLPEDPSAGDEADSPEDEEVNVLDLPGAPPAPLDVRDILLSDIAQLQNIRPAHHGIEKLAETMHLEGQLQPCVVRPAPEGASHGLPFELIFGYRRYTAAEALGWETLRCEVREIGDERKRRQLIIENFQREDLSGVAEARAMYDLKYSEQPPLSNAEVARQLGCDPSHVSHRLNMLIKLAPPRPENAPPAAHELPAKPAADTDESEEREEREDGEPAELAVNAPAANYELPSQSLHLSGDPTPAAEGEDAAEGDEQAPPANAGLDILALVDEGTISASVAEIIASLDNREDQEKLTKLVLRNDWGVKKAAEWARGVKRNDISTITDESDELGPIEMLDIADVTPLQKLVPRKDLTDEEIDRVVVYMQLRNGMDREVLDYITERLGYSYETLWDYVSLLDDEQVASLKRRLALRYISAAHRFFELEPTLKDALGDPEAEIFEETGHTDVEELPALPAANQTLALSAIEDLLALGPQDDTP